MSADWGTEAFEGHFADVLERKPFANAQLGNCVRNEDLFRLRVCAETGGKLNGASKEIVMLFHRLAGCSADSDLERMFGIRFRMLVQFALDLNGAANRARCRDE